MLAGSKQLQIDDYQVTHNVIGEPVNVITCFLRGGHELGWICFYPRGQVPPSRVQGTGGEDIVFILNCEIDRYQDIIETLRYETPISGFVRWDNNRLITEGSLDTDLEPVGEQEGVQLLAPGLFPELPPFF
jgi:hypothetical protein